MSGPAAPLLDLLHAAFHEPDQRIYRIVNTTVWLLIALSVGLFTAELVLEPTEGQLVVLRVIDQLVLAIFALEIVGRQHDAFQAELVVEPAQ